MEVTHFNTGIHLEAHFKGSKGFKGFKVETLTSSFNNINMNNKTPQKLYVRKKPILLFNNNKHHTLVKK